jgi:DNA polymerase-3 subunit delta'
VLKRAINPKTGKLMTVLSVDEIRRLANFFGMTSGAGGWRVAIVDTADDMNDNAANALLKMLEEPPGPRRPSALPWRGWPAAVSARP